MGYVRKPIIDFIDFMRVMFETLHLFIRISEQLIWILMAKINEKDATNSMYLEHRPNLKIFKTFLEEKCKIQNPLVFNTKDKTIKLRKKINAGQTKKIFECFYALDENDMDENVHTINEKANKSSLQKVFPKLNLLVENKVFGRFLTLYGYMVNYSKMPLDLGAYNEELKLWLEAYLKLNQKEDDKKELTPYIHIFVFHTSKILAVHGNIHLFNTQGLEKFNDVVKQYYRRSTNKRNDKDGGENFVGQIMNCVNRNEIEKFGVTIREIEHKIIRDERRRYD